jgi:hypothetical protein
MKRRFFAFAIGMLTVAHTADGNLRLECKSCGSAPVELIKEVY